MFFAFVVFALFIGVVWFFTFTANKARPPQDALIVPVSAETVIEGHYNVLDKEFECTVCGHTEFAQRTAQLNTAGLTFMKLDWMNESARCLVCKSCGYVHWFVT